jgi:hypothetical protein
MFQNIVTRDVSMSAPGSEQSRLNVHAADRMNAVRDLRPATTVDGIVTHGPGFQDIAADLRFLIKLPIHFKRSPHGDAATARFIMLHGEMQIQVDAYLRLPTQDADVQVFRQPADRDRFQRTLIRLLHEHREGMGVLWFVEAFLYAKNEEIVPIRRFDS